MDLDALDLGAGTTALLLSRGLEIGAVVKRTYALRPGERLEPAETQLPLRDVPETEEGDLVEDIDTLPWKPACDLVVKAVAHAPRGAPVRELEAAVTADGRRVAVRVVGQRRVVRRDGRFDFSDPELFTEMPVTYRNAYGGVDAWARPGLDGELLDTVQKSVLYDLSRASLAVYRRNPAGKGYVIRERPEVEGMALPTVEDPEDLLRPDRLFSGDPLSWYRQPVPACFDWLAWDAFPRCLHFGWGRLPLPAGADPASLPFREVARGVVDASLLSPRPLSKSFTADAANGAPPPLVFERLHRGTEVVLENLHPRLPELRFAIPAERPGIAIQPLGERERDVAARIITVRVDVPAGLVSLVWAGSLEARAPHSPEQLERAGLRVSW